MWPLIKPLHVHVVLKLEIWVPRNQENQENQENPKLNQEKNGSSRKPRNLNCLLGGSEGASWISPAGALAGDSDFLVFLDVRLFFLI